jgi:tetratricopeptide (TPR) repeat protein
LLRDCLRVALQDPEHATYVIEAIEHFGRLSHHSSELREGLSRHFEERDRLLLAAIALETPHSQSARAKLASLLDALSIAERDFTRVKGEKVLNHLLHREAKRPDALTSWALIEQLVEMDRPEEALQKAVHLPERYPDFVWAWLCLADHYDRHGDATNQVAVLQRALAHFPNHTRIMTALAEAYDLNDRPEHAVPIYLALFEATKSIGVLSNLCDVMRDAGDERLLLYLERLRDASEEPKPALEEEITQLRRARAEHHPSFPSAVPSRIVRAQSSTFAAARFRSSIRTQLYLLLPSFLLFVIQSGELAVLGLVLLALQLLLLVNTLKRAKAADNQFIG